MASHRNLRNIMIDTPDQELSPRQCDSEMTQFSVDTGDGQPSQCVSDQTSQTSGSIAVTRESDQLHAISGTETPFPAQNTSSNVEKTSQDPLLKVLELLEINKQEIIRDNAKQLASVIKEVQQDFRRSMQELSEKFEDKLQRAHEDLDNRADRLERTVERNYQRKLTQYGMGWTVM
jgi:transposase